MSNRNTSVRLVYRSGSVIGMSTYDSSAPVSGSSATSLRLKAPLTKSLPSCSSRSVARGPTIAGLGLKDMSSCPVERLSLATRLRLTPFTWPNWPAM